MRKATFPTIAGKAPADAAQPSGLNGIIVMVIMMVTHEPRAPRTPSFLFQNPKNKSPSFAVAIEKRENERFLPLNSRHLRGEKTVGGVWDNLPTFRRVLA